MCSTLWRNIINPLFPTNRIFLYVFSRFSYVVANGISLSGTMSGSKLLGFVSPLSTSGLHVFSTMASFSICPLAEQSLIGKRYFRIFRLADRVG
ncbi:Uncharacterized protein TCM_041194 [Theobroma cacao]|uniref:Uncharacterized protein n=1 Tax=Theobroma cacao TaxID=3641 RepID=A0A061GUU1_THECC|nr:Uncharacterized protein TCM_041194 [Theobroma cacao]